MAGGEMRAQPGGEHAIPAVRALFPKGGIELLPAGVVALVAAPDVVDEDIEAVLRNGDGFAERSHLFIVSVVAGDGDAAPAARAGLFGRLVDARAGQERVGQLAAAAAAGDVYRRVGSGQFDRDAPACAPAGAGYQGDAAG